jgi:transposase
VQVLGVDDWAWKKGTTFGTILVDLERSQVVDVLPERSALALSQWLARHPEVKIISRDRQGVYAEGARLGAPEALQVADRFHLLLNLPETVERALALERPHLRLPAPSVPMPESTDAVEPRKGRQFRTRSRVQQQATEAARQRRQQQLELFAEIKKMKAAGLKVSQIAAQLGLNRRRIDRWVRLDALPERNRMAPRPGLAESFRDYLRQRWEAGVRHGRRLFAEIQKRGYRGSYSHLAKLLSPGASQQRVCCRQPKKRKSRRLCCSLQASRYRRK